MTRGGRQSANTNHNCASKEIKIFGRLTRLSQSALGSFQPDFADVAVGRALLKYAKITSFEKTS